VIVKAPKTSPPTPYCPPWLPARQMSRTLAKCETVGNLPLHPSRTGLAKTGL